ncbi:Low molecular weight protein-tyrosine-phosphatase YfkJ [Planctomycetes bacterium Poly30]|uniref:protein-tyrosine-phosphatase n=1 Tax=Saltatorellus ferox TaxID=2528018 RepID=A0A518EYR9_9BACT|nr:Low molecular weight protein-tyrosine-phosphatase YfkJ [Planctomycetes bacterium Poly30]
MTSILFVCLGNICRSPAAEAAVRKRRPDLTLDSAGTGGWHVGKPPYEPMQEAARARGLDLSKLRARQFSAADFGTFDVIVAMDEENARDIESLRPDGSFTPVVLFTDHIGEDGMAVPDPYYTRDFEGCLDLIEACADGLVAGLSRDRS